VLNASGYIVAQRKAAVASKVTGRLDALQHSRLFIQASKQQNFSLSGCRPVGVKAILKARMELG